MSVAQRVLRRAERLRRDRAERAERLRDLHRVVDELARWSWGIGGPASRPAPGREDTYAEGVDTCRRQVAAILWSLEPVHRPRISEPPPEPPDNGTPTSRSGDDVPPEPRLKLKPITWASAGGREGVLPTKELEALWCNILGGDDIEQGRAFARLLPEEWRELLLVVEAMVHR